MKLSDYRHSTVLAGLLVYSAGGFVTVQAESVPFAELQGYLQLGQRDGWTGSFEGPVYRLRNDGDASAIRYFYTVPPPGVGMQEVSVRVRPRLPEAGGDAASTGGGLLWGYDPQSEEYYACVLRADGGVALYRSRGRGVQELSVTRRDAIQPETAHQITIKARGAGFQCYVDDMVVGGLDMEGVKPGAGFGLIALGAGRFGYEGLRTTTMNVPVPAAPPAESPQTAREIALANRPKDWETRSALPPEPEQPVQTAAPAVVTAPEPVPVQAPVQASVEPGVVFVSPPETSAPAPAPVQPQTPAPVAAEPAPVPQQAAPAPAAEPAQTSVSQTPVIYTAPVSTPQPQAPAADDGYFVVRKGQTSGPYALTQLQEDARTGRLKGNMLVWNERFGSHWAIANDVPDLAAYLPQVAKPAAQAQPQPAPIQPVQRAQPPVAPVPVMQPAQVPVQAAPVQPAPVRAAPVQSAPQPQAVSRPAPAQVASSTRASTVVVSRSGLGGKLSQPLPVPVVAVQPAPVPVRAQSVPPPAAVVPAPAPVPTPVQPQASVQSASIQPVPVYPVRPAGAQRWQTFVVGSWYAKYSDPRNNAVQLSELHRFESDGHYYYRAETAQAGAAPQVLAEASGSFKVQELGPERILISLKPAAGQKTVAGRPGQQLIWQVVDPTQVRDGAGLTRVRTTF